MSDQKQAMCEACQIRPVEEPDVYTKCAKCVTQLARGVIVSNCPRPHAMFSKRRGRRGLSVHSANSTKKGD